MKKTNKKGFTLAELLIVIAIIAVLIAIAIPTFSGALRNARLQTDHANIRSAYAMVMTANMMGGIDIDGELTTPTADEEYYFEKDGTLAETSTKAGTYITQEDGKGDECKASIGCVKYGTAPSGSTDKLHKKNQVIKISYDADATGDKWTLSFEAAPTT